MVSSIHSPLPHPPTYIPQKTNPNNSAVFQAGGLVVVLVEVVRKAYLASIVPVIINAVLNEHQLVLDIVAFVSKGDFPRSRLGEKQRGKILASWVTRKLRTIAQFGIRDPEAADSQITEVAEPRSAVGSIRGIGSSLKNVETITEQPPRLQQDFAPLPLGVSEMPAPQPYESSIVESPPLHPTEEDRDETPTELRSDFVDDAELYLSIPQDNGQENYYSQQHPQEPPEHAFNFSPPSHENPFTLNTASSPTSNYDAHSLSSPLDPSRTQFPPRQQSTEYSSGGRATGAGNGGGAGALHVANATSAEEEDEWPQEAIMHMNLGSSGPARQGPVGGYGGGGGPGYGHAL